MDEKEKQEEQNEEVVPQFNLLEEARKERQALQEQLDRREKLLEREEALAAANMLGGRSSAGQAPITKKELTAKEYKDIVMQGKLPDG